MTTRTEPTIQTLNETPEQLWNNLKRRGGLRVSIHMPIATEPPQSEKNASRLKDLYQSARSKLIENGLDEANADALLRPVTTLIDEPRSMLRPAEALALYLDNDSAFLVELPYTVESQVVVGNRFLIKPTLPLLERNASFTVACLSRGQIQVYQGTQLGICEIDVPDMPTALEETTQFDDPEKSLQHHTAKRGSDQGRPGSAPVPQMHGQGLPSDMEASQCERFFRDVANALHKHLANDRSPLVLIGLDENLGLFQAAVDWKDRKLLSIHHDPQDLSKSEIIDHAVEALVPLRREVTAEKLSLLQEALEKDSGVFDTGKCAIAAANGRVDMACVASNREEPGICHPEKMEVEYVEAGDAGCVHDLLETIAYETLQHGGEVFVLPADQVPGSGNAAATVRFAV